MFGINVRAEDHMRIMCIIPEKRDTVFWSEIEDGIRQEAEAEQIELSVIYTETKSAVSSIGINDALEIALLARADAVILSYNDADENTNEALLRARQEGIKIIFVDSDADSRLRDRYVGIDNEEAGYQLARYALSQMEEGSVAFVPIMSNYNDKANFRARIEGIRKAFQDCPDRLTEYKVASDSKIQRVAEIRAQLSEAAPVGALICCNEQVSVMGAQVLDSLAEGGTIGLYGFDRSGETELLLQNGKLSALVSQNNTDLGIESVKAAVGLLGPEQEVADKDVADKEVEDKEVEDKEMANKEEEIHLVEFELLTEGSGSYQGK